MADKLVSVSDSALQFPDNVRARIAANLADPTTAEGAAAAQIIGLPGPQGNPGPEGLPGVNAVDNDTAVAGYIATAGSSATKRALAGSVLGSSAYLNNLATSANLLSDPGAEYGSASLINDATGVTVASSSDWARTGTKSWKCTYSSGGGTFVRAAADFPIAAGQSFVFAGYFKNGASAARDVGLTIRWLDASGATLGTTNGVVVNIPAGAVSPLATVTGVNTYGAVKARVLFRRAGSSGAAAGDVIYADDLYANVGTTVPTLPLDGDQEFSYWSGAAGTSKSVRVNPAPIAPTATQTAQVQAPLTKSHARTIICNGDSITANGNGSTPYPAALQTLLGDGYAVTNLGYAGKDSGDIGIVNGGVIPHLTVAGGQIPADTSSVAVTFPEQSYNYRGGEATAFTGKVAGIPVALTKDATEAWTIARTTAGSAVAVPAGTAFTSNASYTTSYGLNIIWSGRNDMGFITDAITGIINATNQMITHQTGTVDIARYLVLSILTQQSETSGTTLYTKVTSGNAKLRAAYGKNYFNIRRVLIDHGLELAGITPTAADTTAVAADTMPPSLMGDNTHPNDACKVVEAKLIHDQLVIRGWLDRPLYYPQYVFADAGV